MTGNNNLKEMGQRAREAYHCMARATTEQKNLALKTLLKNLIESRETILEANQRDFAIAKAAGTEEAMLDRLLLCGRLENVIDVTQSVIALPDPIGKEIESRTLPNGLTLTKRRTPIGVLGVIYESRPNVTIDVAALTIKTGNCAILRGGSETLNSNRALVSVIQNTLKQVGLPPDAIQFIDSADRSRVIDLLRLQKYVDLIIPRGGAGLHEFCLEHSKIPVIIGGIGICHLFVDESANQEKALEVIDNAKTQRPAVCNALDTLLVHKNVANNFIPSVINKLGKEGVSFRLDPAAWQIFESQRDQLQAKCEHAKSEDWDREWLSLILGIRVVNDLDEALEHIQTHSTGHSDGILTQDEGNANHFVDEIDSSSVYVNASTRFTDGGQFGLGAEIAISTQKLHARGPMGLEELTSYKWIVKGDYHVRS
ncbi:MAG: Gamma-glutamyl phosphate reductase [Chlamydiae bacterium]|nr:Gamma-glutamyl phosphate reductase [Chlamydiota bacterium]